VHINAGSLILRKLFQRLPSAQDTAEVLGRSEDHPVARAWGQTLFRPPAEIDEIEPVRPGTGKGAFVVVAADRTEDDFRSPGGRGGE